MVVGGKFLTRVQVLVMAQLAYVAYVVFYMYVMIHDDDMMYVRYRGCG